MCVALIVPAMTLPSRATLRDCEKANSDGAGVAWAWGGKVHWRKGLNSDQVYQLLKEHKKVNRLAHFRYATAGAAVPALTHPFPLSKSLSTALRGTADSVLIHNGHWGDWEDCYKGFPNRKPPGPWSDTRFIAYLIKQGYANATDFAGQKIATMRGSGEYDYTGKWVAEKGVLYSNTYFRWTYVPYAYSKPGKAYSYEPTDYEQYLSKLDAQDRAWEMAYERAWQSDDSPDELYYEVSPGVFRLRHS